ncbi:hypothetical protein HK100_010479 [Physocladia obscura]|uniref:Uncharacterized protein n=1 Tax=Physocladia obscura TaxID=109957 RepID=A0AAD5XH12_9FUNG|nr:hypothetical protein HK100_010479 [Physocladia obscura]
MQTQTPTADNTNVNASAPESTPVLATAERTAFDSNLTAESKTSIYNQETVNLISPLIATSTSKARAGEKSNVSILNPAVSSKVTCVAEVANDSSSNFDTSESGDENTQQFNHQLQQQQEGAKRYSKHSRTTPVPAIKKRSFSEIQPLREDSPRSPGPHPSPNTQTPQQENYATNRTLSSRGSSDGRYTGNTEWATDIDSDASSDHDEGEHENTPADSQNDFRNRFRRGSLLSVEYGANDKTRRSLSHASDEREHEYDKSHNNQFDFYRMTDSSRDASLSKSDNMVSLFEVRRQSVEQKKSKKRESLPPDSQPPLPASHRSENSRNHSTLVPFEESQEAISIDQSIMVKVVNFHFLKNFESDRNNPQNNNPKSLLSKHKSALSSLPMQQPSLFSSAPTSANQKSSESSRASESISPQIPNNDPFLMKLISLTSTGGAAPALRSPPLSAEKPPPPRTSSFRYDPAAGSSVSPPSTRTGSPSPGQQHQLHQPTVATLSRAQTARDRIAARYAVMARACETDAGGYNLLAVIRYRREAWQAAVKARAPAQDLRKVRMLRGGWGVGTDEFDDYLTMKKNLFSTVGTSTATASTFSAIAGQSGSKSGNDGGDKVGRGSSGSTGGSIGRKKTFSGHGMMDIFKTGLSRPRSDRSLKSVNSTDVVVPANAMPTAVGPSIVSPNNSNNIGYGFENISFMGGPSSSRVGNTPAIAGISLASALTDMTAAKSESSPATRTHSPEPGTRESASAQRVLKRLRSGTVALNAMLGKSMTTRSRMNSSKNARQETEIFNEVGREEIEENEIDEPRLLSMFLSGELNKSVPTLDSGGFVIEGSNAAAGTATKNTDIFEGNELASMTYSESNDVANDTSGIQKMLQESETAQQGRTSRNVNSTTSTKNIRRSPDRGRIIDDFQQWMGGNNNSREGGRGHHGFADENVGFEDDESQKRGGKKGTRGMGSLGRNRHDEPLSPPEAATDNNRTSETKKKKEKRSRTAGGMQRKSNQHDEGTNNIFGIPRRKKEASNQKQKTHLFGTRSILSEEKPQHLSSQNAPSDKKKKKSNRLGRLDQAAKINTSSSFEEGSISSETKSDHLVVRRRKNSLKYRKKNSLIPPSISTEKSARRDSFNERSIGGWNRYRDIDAASNAGIKGTVSSLRSAEGRDTEQQILETANSLQKLLLLVLEVTKKRRDTLLNRLEAYDEICKTYSISNDKSHGELKEISNTDQLNSSIISAKFITHEAQYMNLKLSLERSNETISSDIRILEEGDMTIKSMLTGMDKLGTEINEIGSRRLKAIEDVIQHKEAVKNGPMNTLMELVYQFLEALLIAIGYIIWLIYKAFQLSQSGYKVIMGAKKLPQIQKLKRGSDES